MHDRITDHCHLDNTLTRNARFFYNFADKIVQCRAYGVRHLDFATGIHHHIGNAAHQIFAKANLRVHQTGRRQGLTIIKIGKMRGDGGGTHINGNTISGLNQARINRDNIVAFANGDGDFPFALAKRLLQATQHRQIGHCRINIPLCLERFNKTRIIR